jgi:succinyl-CoA synthetase beta subunit
MFGQYPGLELDATTQWQSVIAGLPSSQLYVVKVDQAVKSRFKKGLVELKVPAAKVALAAAKLFDHGYRYLLVEPFVPHAPADERYLAYVRRGTGVVLLYGREGGIEVEGSTDGIKELVLDGSPPAAAARTLGVSPGTLTKLHQFFNHHHLTFLELNPLLVSDGTVMPLDAAAEADDAASGQVPGSWAETDFRQPAGSVSPEEAAVADLDAGTPASFRLRSLNPNGSIFVLLSGGGASLVLADEICHQGYGPLLGNYGEYSGDPAPSEVQAYTRQVLSLLLRSRSRPKVLLIAGGVANFTDVRATFSGIITALEEVKSQLRQQGVRVYVRRGGPFAAQGLAAIESFLASEMLLGEVAGPELSLADAAAATTAPFARVAQ